MNLIRIYAIVLRHLYTWSRSLNKLTDAFWWPFVDLFTWGLMTVYISSRLQSPAGNLVLLFLSSLILWTVIYRSQWEISMILNEEVWSRNLLNIFASPLTAWEFLTATVILSVIKLSAVLSFMAAIAWALYRYNLFALGLPLVPFVGLLCLFAWSLGLLINSFIIRFGRDSEALAWTAVFLIQPFSCVFYPLAFLPAWAQPVALMLPSTYIFEGLRSLLFTGIVPALYYWMALFLGLVYLLISLIVFKLMFEKAKGEGLLARLLD